jgi:hypothetical protein
MSTMEELEQRAAQMSDAEGAAVAALAAGMRELAVQLPTGSLLALTLATSAKRLDPWGTPDGGRWGAAVISTATLQIVNEQDDQWGVEA